ncbi:MAG: class I SAM-dependent methyltransferase [Verrucomicrobiota bacterium]
MRLTERVHAALSKRLRPGDLAIDATMGNGHDTLHLSKLTAPNGKVWAFDIQKAALEKTRERLKQANEVNVSLICANHNDLEKHLPRDAVGIIKAVVFNLGYLPGQDKSITTHASTTLAAIHSAIRVIAPGGVIEILCYTGHYQGLEEWQMLESWISKNLPESVTASILSPFDATRRPPVWLEIEKH